MHFDEHAELRTKIIGLGENSIHKSYYAQLKERAVELERFRAILDRSSEMIILAEAQSHLIVDVNATVCNLFGQSKEKLLQTPLEEWFAPNVIEHLLANCGKVGKNACTHCSQTACKICTVTEIVMETPQGTFPIEFSLQRATFGGIEYFVLLGSDISERKKAEEQIYTLAFYDPLTKLPNRQLLFDRISHALANSKRHRKYGALLFIDLDNFKSLNDTKGHHIGDELLVQVSRRIESILREGDTLGRLGGDEFVVLLEGLSPEKQSAAIESEHFAYRIKHIVNLPYTLFGYEHTISPSIGVVLFVGDEKNKESLIKHADIAMYQAKQSGRNTIRYYDPLMQKAIQNKLLMEKELKIAIQENQLVLFYQPQIDTKGKLVGFEALVRWNHPKKGLVPPLEFIPLCEESGLIIYLGKWVIEQACHQIKIWQTLWDEPLHVSINVSVKQFQELHFYEIVEEILGRTEARADWIKFELTESLIVDNVEETIKKIMKLRSLGVKFSLDDFGTGYSSLSYLKKLPLDELKIDQSFVRDISTDINDAMIVKTIIDMASNFDLEVVAEGVETQEQLQFLTENGCRIFQGYFFGKPMPHEEIERIYFTL